MNNKDERKIDRRGFMISSASGAIVGLSCLSIGLKEALAQARQTGKPLLTEESLNNLFTVGGSNERSMVAARIVEAKQDVKGFIRSRFTLTPAQEAKLESLSAEQLETIRRLLESAEKTGTTLKVSFGRPVEDPRQTSRKKDCPVTFNFTFNFTL